MISRDLIHFLPTRISPNARLTLCQTALAVAVESRVTHTAETVLVVIARGIGVTRDATRGARGGLFQTGCKRNIIRHR